MIIFIKDYRENFMMTEESKKAERWLPIESNPEVMNSFLRKLGVPADWEINDVFGLDPELLLMLPQPVLALMLLFPITDNYKQFVLEKEEAIKNQTVSDKLYYMKQTISNACGTVARHQSTNLDIFIFQKLHIYPIGY